MGANGGTREPEVSRRSNYISGNYSCSDVRIRTRLKYLTSDPYRHEDCGRLGLSDMYRPPSVQGMAAIAQYNRLFTKFLRTGIVPYAHGSSCSEPRYTWYSPDCQAMARTAQRDHWR